MQDEILVRYLLDDATEAERQEIEERFFADDSFFEELAALEDELHYEYQQNNLNARERAAFERKFLRSPKDRAKSDFAGAFLEATAEIAEKKTIVPEKNAFSAPVSQWSISSLFNFSPMSFGLATAGLLLMCGIGFLIFQNSRLRGEIADLQNDHVDKIRNQEQILTDKQRQQAELERQVATEREKNDQNEQRIAELEAERQKLEREIIKAQRQIKEPVTNSILPKSRQPPSVISLALAPGLFTRGGSASGNSIQITPAVKNLRLNLLLKNAGKYPFYRATLNDIDAGEVWTSTNLKSRGKGARRRVSFNIQAGILKRADYELTLVGIKENGETEEITSYYFSILR